MDPNKDGKVALLLGLWTEATQVAAQRMAAQGMQLLLVGPDNAALDRAAWKINGAGGEAHVILSDLYTWGERAVRSFREATCFDRVDVLCLSPFGRPEVVANHAAPSSRFSVVVPDMQSIVLPLLACLSQMRQQNYGRVIVNLSESEQWGCSPHEDRMPMFEDLIGTFIGLLADTLAACDITANVLMKATFPHDAEATAQAILHLASEAGSDLTGRIVRVVPVEALARNAPDVERHLLSALCEEALRDLPQRVN